MNFQKRGGAMRRLGAFLLAIALTMALSGCNNKNAEHIFRYDSDQTLLSLDPQFATRSTDRMVIANCFEGLMAQNSAGELAPGAAATYTMSADGLRYTFTLREGLSWSDGSALTAEDFQFALQRLFDSQSPSPFATNLLCIAGSQAMLDGSGSAAQLGIQASGNQLTLRLEYPNPELLSLLAASYTAPCKESFFHQQKGRYGISKATVLYNGPFTVTTWDNTKSVALRQNEEYVGEEPTLATGVNLYIRPEGDPVDRLLEGKTDAAVVPFARLEEVRKANCTTSGLEDTTWALVFNLQQADYAQPEVRKALALAIDREALARSLTGDAQHTNLLIPPAVHLVGNMYRDVAGDTSFKSSQTPRSLLVEGLTLLEKTRLDKTDLLVPNGDMERAMASSLQRSWLDKANATINILPLEETQLASRIAARNFQIALVEVRALGGSAEEILRRYTGNSQENIAAYQSEEYDQLIQQAAMTTDVGQTGQKLAEAEHLLLQDAIVVPLYNTATYTATATKIHGIQFDGMVSGCYFKYATMD